MNQHPQEIVNNNTRQQTRPIRVMILDATPVERKIIATVLGREECEVPVGSYQQAWERGGYGPSRNKYAVSSFENAAEALQALLYPEQPPPDVLLLDLSLPRISGLQVLKQCKETSHLQHMPIVVIAQQGGQPGTLLKVTLAGASAHLVRPVKEEMIRNTVIKIEQDFLYNSGIWTD